MFFSAKIKWGIDLSSYLVTGGCGFIGSHLVEKLNHLGHRVIVIDDLSTGSLSNVSEAVPVFVGSVTDSILVSQVIENVDGCFHLAAIASVEYSNNNWLGSNNINLGGTLTILDAARRSNLPPIPIVYASSAAVYGDNPSIPLTEDDLKSPLTAYGADKLSCELQAKVAGLIHKIPTIGFRFFNVYGSRQQSSSPYSGVISIFTERIYHGKPITIYGDGNQVRDFVFVEDVVDCLIASIEHASISAPVYNICTGRGTSIYDLAHTIGKLLDVVPIINHSQSKAGDIRASIGNPEKLFNELGLRCKTSLENGLALTIKWLSETDSNNEKQ